MAGAIVLQLDKPYDDPFPSQGPVDRGKPFHRPVTRSDSQGHFTLTDLTPGTIHVYASKGTSIWSPGIGSLDRLKGKEFVGAAQATFRADRGHELEWNPELTRGLGIHGRVKYADGTPMSNVFVAAKSGEDDWASTAFVDDNGTFELGGLEQRAYTISVQVHELPLGARPLEMHDVFPSETEILLTADFLPKVEEVPATAHARIVDSADRVDGILKMVFHSQKGVWYQPELDAGVWSCQIEPGLYQAQINNDGVLVGQSEWIDVQPGSVLDFGEVHTSPACSVLVRVQRPEEMQNMSVWVSLIRGEGAQAGAKEIAPDKNEWLFEDKLEGEVTVSVSGPGFIKQQRQVKLSAARTELDFQMERAASCRIQLDTAPNQRTGFGELKLVLYNADGSVYFDTIWVERWGGQIPVDFTASVPVGELAVKATTSTGLEATGVIRSESVEDRGELSLMLE